MEHNLQEPQTRRHCLIIETMRIVWREPGPRLVKELVVRHDLKPDEVLEVVVARVVVTVEVALLDGVAPMGTRGFLDLLIKQGDLTSVGKPHLPYILIPLLSHQLLPL